MSKIESLLDSIWYTFGIGEKGFDKRASKRWEKEDAEKKVNCANGKHIPVRYVGGLRGDGPDDYFCQECYEPVTSKDHETFFSTPEMKKMKADRLRILGW